MRVADGGQDQASQFTFEVSGSFGRCSVRSLFKPRAYALLDRQRHATGQFLA